MRAGCRKYLVLLWFGQIRYLRSDQKKDCCFEKDISLVFMFRFWFILHSTIILSTVEETAIIMTKSIFDQATGLM